MPGPGGGLDRKPPQPERCKGSETQKGNEEETAKPPASGSLPGPWPEVSVSAHVSGVL